MSPIEKSTIMLVFLKNVSQIYLCKCHGEGGEGGGGGGANFVPKALPDICQNNLLLDLKHLFFI